MSLAHDETAVAAASATSYTLGALQAGAPCCAPTPLIEVEQLGVRYRGVAALQGVSLSIPRGCITALIGPSGCGKTSFLSCLNRLIDLSPQAAVTGCVRYGGQDIRAPEVDVRQLRRHIGVIFQKPNPFPCSIRKNLDMPLREHGARSKAERAGRIERALMDVGLWGEVKDRLDGPATLLSGGQQQRLCIARALVLQPKVLLMDEPCSALDPQASGVVEDLILRLQGAYTVVIVTHNLPQARRIANYAAFFWMQEAVGRLVEFGRCSELFDAPAHALTAAYVSGARG